MYNAVPRSSSGGLQASLDPPLYALTLSIGTSPAGTKEALPVGQTALESDQHRPQSVPGLAR
jgi:hypothetical protein